MAPIEYALGWSLVIQMVGMTTISKSEISCPIVWATRQFGMEPPIFHFALSFFLA